MDLQQFIQNQSDFSLSLAKHVITTHAKDKNLVFSPLSIHIALSMVAAGSDGPTRDELLGFLKSKSNEDLNFLLSEIVTEVFAKSNGGRRRPRLSLANGVWVEQSNRLKPAFREIMHNSYKAASNHVDFENKAEEVREEVNAWAEKETNGLIKDLLQPGSITPGTMLILANAVYFKGTWQEEFDESVTRDLEFFFQSGSSIKAPFMCGGGSYQFICSFDGFKVLRLPYVKAKDDRKFSMYFFLPDAKDEMGMGCCMMREETVDFVAGHPFVFVVREDVSGVVLFVGQLLNPSLDE